MFWTELTHWLTQKHDSGFLSTNLFGFREQLLTTWLSFRLSFNLYFEIKEELERK